MLESITSPTEQLSICFVVFTFCCCCLTFAIQFCPRLDYSRKSEYVESNAYTSYRWVQDRIQCSPVQIMGNPDGYGWNRMCQISQLEALFSFLSASILISIVLDCPGWVPDAPQCFKLGSWQILGSILGQYNTLSNGNITVNNVPILLLLGGCVWLIAWNANKSYRVNEFPW